MSSHLNHQLILSASTPTTVTPLSSNIQALQSLQISHPPAPTKPLLPSGPIMSIDALNSHPQGDFECFSDLPIEIRYAIWEEAANAKADIEIRIVRNIEKAKSTSKKEIKVNNEMAIAEFVYHYRAIQVRNDTGMLTACKESSYIFLKHKKLPDTFRIWKRGKDIKFDGKKDEIYISNVSAFYLYHLRKRLRPANTFMFGLENIRNLTMIKPYDGMQEDMKDEIRKGYKDRITEIEEEEKGKGNLTSPNFWKEFFFEFDRLTSEAGVATRCVNRFRKLRLRAGVVITDKVDA